MKKSILILLCAVLAVGSCGCKKDDISNAISDVKDTLSETVSDAVSSSDEQYYLTYDYNIGYTVDADGNEIGKYTLEDYKGVFKEIGVDYEYGVSIDGMYDGIIYFHNTDYSGDESVTSYYAIDGSSKNWANFYNISGEWSPMSFDYYQGKVYVDIRTYEDNIRQDERVFTVDKDSLTLVEGASEVSDILKNHNGSLIQPAKDNECIQRTYDELGFLVVGKITEDGDETKWSFSKLTADGETAIEGLQNTGKYLTGYSKNYLYLRDFDDDDIIMDCYNLEDGKAHTIRKDNSSDFYLAYEDGVVYYEAITEKQYGVEDYSVYRYDCSRDQAALLYTTSKIPGTDNNRFGIDGFKIIDGKIYALQFFGNEEKWARFNESNGTFEDLDLSVKEYSVFNYGTINYYSYTEKCSACGTIVSKNYGENFVLDAKYSSHADEINKLLSYADAKNGEIVTDAYTDDCDWHKENEEQGCETDETTVSDVSIIDDRFLEVQMADYWYGGGAHGMPGRGTRLFDLTTGEELDITAFYKGTEEEFKTLVAGKVKEDYQNGSEKYFAADAEEAYSNAYESTHIDSGNLIWYEDHAVYYFYPYDLGPYASGFIDIELPYDEFLGANQLTRIAK
ncbi:Protein of unknown function [Pseudobutyrivibrio sp. 49]|uniref:RsiV family protein n=1 Tax=Pseudobutyrivibrio sp. 49 TaxID=1855344 RepID=UPI00088AF5CB|nr:DUF3298 domain-containing protein [Pseudobutyrivibrio sp. 49]SDH24480.1 Protein of unknown function [Pseudobutyrivibrio sp. 49]